VEARKIGEWRAVERDMADWALKRGRLRRTDASCRKRYAALEPEKFEQHLQVWRARALRGSNKCGCVGGFVYSGW